MALEGGPSPFGYAGAADYRLTDQGLPVFGGVDFERPVAWSDPPLPPGGSLQATLRKREAPSCRTPSGLSGSFRATDQRRPAYTTSTALVHANDTGRATVRRRLDTDTPTLARCGQRRRTARVQHSRSRTTGNTTTCTASAPLVHTIDTGRAT